MLQDTWNDMVLLDETMVDDVFWSDSSNDEDHDAPELTSSEESVTSSDSDDFPDLVEDPELEGEEKDKLDNVVSGHSGRWLSARMNWRNTIPRRSRSEPWLLDDVILPSIDLINE